MQHLEVDDYYLHNSLRTALLINQLENIAKSQKKNNVLPIEVVLMHEQAIHVGQSLMFPLMPTLYGSMVREN